MEQLTLHDLIGYFEFHNRTEGKSAMTISWYNQSLDLFERFLVKSGMFVHIADIGEPEVRSFIAHLQTKVKWSENGGSGPKLSAEGIQNRVRALKAFFAWLHREGYTASNRLERLKNFKAPRKIVEVLSEDEIGQILSSLDQKTPWGARDYAIIMLMLDSGLRMSEVTGLKSSDLGVDDGRLKVLGKGGKERIVPFGATTQRALWRYAHHFRPEPVATDRFFLVLSELRAPMARK